MPKEETDILINTKNRKYNCSTIKKENCQCMTKIYYYVYSIKKRKYIDYKDLFTQYINNRYYFLLLVNYFD